MNAPRKSQRRSSGKLRTRGHRFDLAPRRYPDRIIKPRKPRGFVATLTAAQRKTLTDWLLKENITYQAAIVRIKEQWGLKTGHTPLERFFQKVARSRLAPPAPASDERPVVLEIVLTIRAGKPVSVSLSRGKA